MAEKYQNKYRIPSARLRNWDYSSDAVYFITICTTNHHYFFGKIENGKMEFSEIGLLVQQEWLKSFELRAELFCDCYVIMPKSISSFVAGFKSVVTANAHKINGRFGWQERFYDHIIRDDPGYQRIRDYIENNQIKWEQDKFFRGFQHL
jgi:REP element-mobilizing transposase RayT